MPLFSLILILVAIGVIMWLVNAHIPMAAPFKQVLNIVVLIVVILWLLNLFGILGDVDAIRVGG